MEENTTVNQTDNNPLKKENKFLVKFKPLYAKVDSKLTKLVPDGKLRKIIIFSLLGLIIFFVLIILLGLLVSVSQPRTDPGYTLNKPSITQNTETEEKPKTETQTKLMKLKSTINNLKFPPSELTIPSIEVGIKLQ